MALCESAIEHHVERSDLPKRLLIADWSLTDLRDRQDHRQLTCLQKKSVAIRSERKQIAT